MIRAILFPTDGSPLSERAFPVALHLARAQHARLLIVDVVSYLGWLDIGPEAYLSASAYQQVVEAMDAEARRNVDRLAGRAQASDVPADTAVLHGSPAAELLDYEEQMRPDLVVMATHGRTGLARFALGSVADTVLREGTVPVLLIRSHGEEAASLSRALVPLDGSALAEKALGMVEQLAGAPVTHVHLCRAIAGEGERADATAYLDKIALRLRDMKTEITTDVSIGEPFEVIASAARSADLVIMATHGRGGLERMRHGSVADQAIHELTAPVLLVRAGARRARRPFFMAASGAGSIQ